MSAPTEPDEVRPPRVFGVIGAGRLGLCLARLALAAGFDVVVAGSGAPVRVRRVVDTFAPGARVAWAAEVAHDAELVALCMPLGAYEDVAELDFAGAAVIDAMNYWPETDGERGDLDDPAHPTSTLVQRAVASVPVIKAFNHVAFRDLDARAHPTRDAHRIGIGVAGDDVGALALVSGFVDALGFDPVVAGSLDDSRVLEPTGPVFGAVLGADALRERLRAG